MDVATHEEGSDTKRRKNMAGGRLSTGGPTIGAIIQEKGKNVPGVADLTMAFMTEHFPLLIGHRSTKGAVKEALWLDRSKYEVILFGLVPIFVSSNAKSFDDVYHFTQDPNSDRFFGFLDVTKILTTVTAEQFGARRFTPETFENFVVSGGFAEVNADNSMIVYRNLTTAGNRWTNNAPEGVYYAAPEGVELLRNFESPDGIVRMANVKPRIEAEKIILVRSIVHAFNEQVMSYHPRNELTVDRMRKTLERLRMALHVEDGDTEKDVLARLSRVLTTTSLFPWRRAGLLQEFSKAKAEPPAIRKDVKHRAQKSAFVYLLATLFVIPSIRDVFVELTGSLYGMSNERNSANKRASKAVDPEARNRANEAKRNMTRQKYCDLDDIALAETVVRLLGQVFQNCSKASPTAWKAVFGNLRSSINATLAAEIDGQESTNPWDAITPEAARWFISEHLEHNVRSDAEGVVEGAKSFPVNFTRTDDVEVAKDKINPVVERNAELKARRIMGASANERRHVVHVVDSEVARGSDILEEIIRSCVVDGLTPEEAGRRCAIAFGDVLCQTETPELTPLVADKLRVQIASRGTTGLPPPSRCLVEISSRHDLPNAGIVVGKCDPLTVVDRVRAPRPPGSGGASASGMQDVVPSIVAPAPPAMPPPPSVPLPPHVMSGLDLPGDPWGDGPIDMEGIGLRSPFRESMSSLWADDLGVSREEDDKHPWMM